MHNPVLDPWWELAITVDDAVADDAAALLIEAGASGTEVLSSDTPAPTLPRVDGSAEIPTPRAQPGATLILASFVATLGEAEVLDAARRALAELGLAPELPLALRRRSDTAWAEGWKQFFTPLSLGPRCWVVPSWERAFVPPPDAVVITLDPGLAFGTGQHATTALCLEMLDADLAAAPAEPRLLDVGCGSGILAIGAALLGCRHIVAIDNDPTAVAVARENATRNAVAEYISTSADDLAVVPGEFDYVVANIIAPVLIELAPKLAAHVALHGTLLLSGVLAEQQEEVLAAFADLSAGRGGGALTLTRRRQRGEWVALALAAAT